MLVEFDLRNKYINYKSQKISFNKGLYFLLGKNGTGKTTLIKSILNNKAKITFENVEESEIFLTDRFRMFAYVPQELDNTDMLVAKYIEKYNQEYDSNEAKRLLKKFGLEKSILKEKFSNLSGGEKIKIAIITAFAKDTPYIFLDEPTNYLDDGSVEVLKEILSEKMLEKSIIISTHDTRLLELHSNKYNLDGKNIQLLETYDIPNAVNITKESKYKLNKKRISFSGLAFKSAKKTGFGLVTLFLLIELIIFGGYYQYSYYLNYSTDDLPEDDYILVYSVDEEYGELNQEYVKSQNMEIDDSNLHNMITFSDVEDIISLDDVEEIYIRDVSRFNKLSGLLYQSFDENSDEKDDFTDTYVFSLPQVIFDNDVFLNLMGISDFAFVSNGRLPEEDCKEVSISPKLLMEYYGYSEENAENAIGSTILINNEEYTIVGINEADVCLISYNQGINCGIYKYSESTFSDFKDYIVNYLTENDYITQNVDVMLIKTKTNKENEVLNKLISQYPSNNFYSKSYVKNWKNSHNASFEKGFILIFAIISLVMGVIFALIQYNLLQKNGKRIRNVEIYYFSEGRIISALINGYILCLIGLVIIGVVVSFIFSNMFGMFMETLPIQVISYMGLIAPSIIVMVITKHKMVKNCVA